MEPNRRADVEHVSNVVCRKSFVSEVYIIELYRNFCFDFVILTVVFLLVEILLFSSLI